MVENARTLSRNLESKNCHNHTNSNCQPFPAIHNRQAVQAVECILGTVNMSCYILYWTQCAEGLLNTTNYTFTIILCTQLSLPAYPCLPGPRTQGETGSDNLQHEIFQLSKQSGHSAQLILRPCLWPLTRLWSRKKYETIQWTELVKINQEQKISSQKEWLLR